MAYHLPVDIEEIAIYDPLCESVADGCDVQEYVESGGDPKKISHKPDTSPVRFIFRSITAAALAAEKAPLLEYSDHGNGCRLLYEQAREALSTVLVRIDGDFPVAATDRRWAECFPDPDSLYLMWLALKNACSAPLPQPADKGGGQ